MHIKKVRTNVTIDKKLLDDARQSGITISGFIDIELRRYLAYIKGKTINDSSHSGREKTSIKYLSQRARGLVGYDVSLTRRRS